MPAPVSFACDGSAGGEDGGMEDGEGGDYDEIVMVVTMRGKTWMQSLGTQCACSCKLFISYSIFTTPNIFTFSEQWVASSGIPTASASFLVALEALQRLHR